MLGPLTDMGYQSSVTRSFSGLIARRTRPSQNHKRHSQQVSSHGSLYGQMTHPKSSRGTPLQGTSQGNL